ncbi:MAG: AMP-binding protein [Clostridiales bacterium GWF2_38_85]|nr:MAG: AMP-binding protein [Clostridiales bacterium GWF2_38_85]HBL84625.1 AMP-binding protein [Clostridiales bacterium]
MIEKTLGDYLRSVAIKYPDRTAVKYTGRDYKRTWKELDEETDKIAKGFMALGIGKGDHVAIWATNVPEWILTLYASAKIGAVLVTVNTSYKVYEAEYLLHQSDAKLLVLIDGFKDADYISTINELCPEMKSSDSIVINSIRLPFLKTIVYAGDKEHKGMVKWDTLTKLGESVSDEEYRNLSSSLNCHEIVNMQYTSGTTGFPKGVMLTHYNIINNGRVIGDGMAFTPNDRLCICVPFFHCFGLVLALMASLTHASEVVPIDAYRPKKVLDALQSEDCTAVHGVPTMFIAMLEHPDFPTYNIPHLRTGIMAGSPCPIKVMEDVVSKMHMRDIVIVYGQTESSPGCTMTTTSDSIEKRVSTVGRSFSGVETKIVNPETGEPLPAGVPGEFCARGYNIMRGYYKMEEATKQTIDKDGWLHTGDLAVVDEEGYYKITGRIKDMIIRGGENIYPKEIEEFIYTLPKVKDVQVIGVPSVQYGEEVCAAVILREGEVMTEDEVKNAVKANMARHKVPSYVAFVDSFPMTASGKIQKFKMREWAIEKYKLNDAANIETA